MSPQKLKSKKLIFCWRKKQDPEPDVTQWYGSPYPYQNVTDPQNRDTVMCFKPEIVPSTVIARGFFGRNKTIVEKDNTLKCICPCESIWGPGRVHWAWSFLEAEFLSDIVIWRIVQDIPAGQPRGQMSSPRALLTWGFIACTGMWTSMHVYFNFKS